MDTDAAHITPTPAPYGHACMSCSKAKSRCTGSKIAGAKCDRCRRLNKECLPSPVVRKRRVVKNPPVSKAARLEEKLDGLVSLLQGASQPASGMPGNVTPTTQTPKFFESLHSSKLGPRDDPRYYPTAPQVSSSSMSPKFSMTPQQMQHIVPTSVESLHLNIANSYHSPNFDVPSEVAEEYLRTFCTSRLKHFPFLNFSSSTTSQSLRQQRPFLWFCIMTVSSAFPAQLLASEIEVRTILGRRMLLEGDRSLDILLGLLVYIAWGQSYQYKPMVSTLIQMALALLGDLGLQRSPPKESPHMMLNYDARGCPRPFSTKERTMEERRVALACYLHGSTISAYFQRTDPPRWSAYLKSCLELLNENKEDFNDTLLALLIRLQLIVDKVTLAPWQFESQVEYGAVTFYTRALKAQLEEVKKAVPEEMEANETFLLHLHYTTLTLHEVALSRSSLLHSHSAITPLYNPTTTCLASTAFDRLSSLTACLYATRSWFTTFLSLPSSDYPGFPIAILVQMTHSIIVLYRLSTFDDVDWDLDLVKEVVDFGSIIDHLMEKIEGIKLVGGDVSDAAGYHAREVLNGENAEAVDNWASMGKRFKEVASWWRARNGAEDTLSNSNGNIIACGAGDGPSGGGVDDIDIEFWDDSWLDLIKLREYHF